MTKRRASDKRADFVTLLCLVIWGGMGVVAVCSGTYWWGYQAGMAGIGTIESETAFKVAIGVFVMVVFLFLGSALAYDYDGAAERKDP